MTEKLKYFLKKCIKVSELDLLLGTNFILEKLCLASSYKVNSFTTNSQHYNM